MFLDITRRRNPQLIEYAAWLHRRRSIPANTFVIDADSVSANAGELARAGAETGIELYVMTKQFGRNPELCRRIVDSGLDRFVAVDVEEARSLWSAGFRVAHVGHLVAVPRYDVEEVVRRGPGLVTVYAPEQARYIDTVAEALGADQRLLLRMYDPALEYHHCQHGGFTLDSLSHELPGLLDLGNVTIAGVTTHPCLTNAGTASPKLKLLQSAREVIHAHTGADVEINAPGVTTATTLPLLATHGVTSAEPGSALTGSTPLHAENPDMPEVPAVVYVTEVSHTFGDRVFVFGGGFYARGRQRGAFVGSDPEEIAASAALDAVASPPEAIDYYGELDGTGRDDIAVGDSVVYAFRNQIFVNRSHVAIVDGLAGSAPRVEGLYDSLGHRTA